MGELTWGSFFLGFLNFKTEKYVIAENRKLGISFRVFQICVLAYVIGGGVRIFLLDVSDEEIINTTA